MVKDLAVQRDGRLDAFDDELVEGAAHARQGLGTLITQAVINRDFPVVQSCVLVAATLYVLVNLVVDILYAVIDPRIKYS